MFFLILRVNLVNKSCVFFLIFFVCIVLLLFGLGFVFGVFFEDGVEGDLIYKYFLIFCEVFKYVCEVYVEEVDICVFMVGVFDGVLDVFDLFFVFVLEE